MSAFRQTIEHIREREIPRQADVQVRTVVAADGPRYMKVQQRQGGKPYSVSTSRTRQPGAQAFVARNGCNPGEILLPDTPPGSRGIFPPIVQATTVPSGNPYGTGCDPLTGFVSFEDVVVHSGSVTFDSDTITIANGLGRVTATLVPSGNQCAPSALTLYPEVFVFNATVFQAAHPRWTVSSPRTLPGGRFQVTYEVTPVVNPTADTYKGYGRFWHQELGQLVYFAHFPGGALGDAVIEL